MAASTLLVCLANVKTIKYAPLPTHSRRQRRIFYSLLPFHPIPPPPLYFAEEDTETTFDFCLPPINYRIQNILLSPHRRNLSRCRQWCSYCLRLAKNLIFNRFLRRISIGIDGGFIRRQTNSLARRSLHLAALFTNERIWNIIILILLRAGNKKKRCPS